MKTNSKKFVFISVENCKKIVNWRSDRKDLILSKAHESACMFLGEINELKKSLSYEGDREKWKEESRIIEKAQLLAYQTRDSLGREILKRMKNEH